MKTMTVSMICAGLMTMGTAAIAGDPMPQDVYTTLAMSHEDGEMDEMGHDEMGGGEMSRDQMGKDDMSDDGMGHGEMGKDEMSDEGMGRYDEMEEDDEMEDDGMGGSGMSD